MTSWAGLIMSCMTNRLNYQESKYTPEDLFCLIIVKQFNTLQILPEMAVLFGILEKIIPEQWNCPFRIPSASSWWPNIYRKCETLWLPLIQPQEEANKQQMLASSSTQKKAAPRHTGRLRRQRSWQRAETSSRLLGGGGGLALWSQC